MALFSKKTKQEVKPKTEKKAVATVAITTASSHVKSVLIRPRVTEKASYVSEKQNAYVFDIPLDATKGAVKTAVIAAYKVVPMRIAIVRTPAKAVFSRGKAGKGARGKKAYVYLRKGDKIEII